MGITPLPKLSMNWEPIELRLLKRQLANLTCNCTVCERNKFFQNYHKRVKCVKEVQVSQHKIMSDQCTQISPCLQSASKCLLSENMINACSKTGFCTNCLLTMNILARRETKTLKDEETETNMHIHCDKCLVKFIRSMERTTSTPNSSPQVYSNFTLSDFVSQCSSDATMPCKYSKRSDKDNMKLIGYGTHKDGQNHNNYMYGNCLYLEDYVDSIRPPL